VLTSSTSTYYSLPFGNFSKPTTVSSVFVGPKFTSSSSVYYPSSSGSIYFNPAGKFPTASYPSSRRSSIYFDPVSTSSSSVYYPSSSSVYYDPVSTSSSSVYYPSSSSVYYDPPVTSSTSSAWSYPYPSKTPIKPTLPITSSYYYEPASTLSKPTSTKYDTTVQAQVTLSVIPIPAKEYYSSMSAAGQAVPSSLSVVSAIHSYPAKPVVPASSGVDVKPVVASSYIPVAPPSSAVNVKPVLTSTFVPVYGTAAPTGYPTKTTNAPYVQYTGAANRLNLGAGAVGLAAIVLAL
jgi:hypothetical protein